jgi:hypothetical protein
MKNHHDIYDHLHRLRCGRLVLRVLAGQVVAEAGEEEEEPAAMSDELDDYLTEAMADPDFQLAYEALNDAKLDRTFRKDGIYRRRWHWWYPWGITRWWQPRMFSGGDEWCNDSRCFVVPPLGCLVVFWRPGRLRELPCTEEWQHMDDLQRADYAPCGYLHGGRLNRRGHHHSLSGILCFKSITWLAAQDRLDTAEE